MTYEVTAKLGSSGQSPLQREFNTKQEQRAFADGLNAAIGWMEMTDYQARKVVRATIELPGTWKRIVGSVFPDDLEGIRDGAERLAGPETPDLYYDDTRFLQRKIGEGAYVTVHLDSDRAGYTGRYEINTEGGPLEHVSGMSSEAFESFGDEEVLEFEDVKIILDITWTQ